MQVNLALPNWIPYALTSLDRYRNLGKPFALPCNQSKAKYSTLNTKHQTSP
jgi:hypothetical protein